MLMEQDSIPVNYVSVVINPINKAAEAKVQNANMGVFLNKQYLNIKESKDQCDDQLAIKITV